MKRKCTRPGSPLQQVPMELKIHRQAFAMATDALIHNLRAAVLMCQLHSRLHNVRGELAVVRFQQHSTRDAKSEAEGQELIVDTLANTLSS